jgi:hypothetical protein
MEKFLLSRKPWRLAAGVAGGSHCPGTIGRSERDGEIPGGGGTVTFADSFTFSQPN